jgi:hypothetical protein
MVTGSELASLCGQLEHELQEAGFAIGNVQFDDTEQILCIVVGRDPNYRSPRTDCPAGATIDAHILWDLLRDLTELGMMNPAIQLLAGNRDR